MDCVISKIENHILNLNVVNLYQFQFINSDNWSDNWKVLESVEWAMEYKDRLKRSSFITKNETGTAWTQR